MYTREFDCKEDPENQHLTGKCYLCLVGKSPLAWLPSGLRLGNLWIVRILGKPKLSMNFIPEHLKTACNMPERVGLLGEGLKWIVFALLCLSL